MRIIGLTGASGAGKDTVADALRRAADADVTAFAHHLYLEVTHAYDLPISLLLRRSAKEAPQTWLALSQCSDPNFAPAILKATGHSVLDLEAPRSPRQILQWWGTDYRRAQDKDYWVAKCYEHLVRIPRMLFQPELVVISDVRFANEADLVRLFEGEIWQIKRPGHCPSTDHISDVDGSGFEPDLVLENIYTARHLQEIAVQALKETANAN